MAKKKDWTPDDPLLASPYAPHEVAAVLRMHRAGWPASLIAAKLGLRGSRLVNSITKALYESQQAAKSNRPVHEQPIKEGTE